MDVQIITPDATVFNEAAEEIRIPTVMGEIAVLPHHENLLTQLTHGELTVRTKKETRYLAITGGFCDIRQNTVSILSDYAVPAEDISVEKAMEAKKRAEEILKKSRESVSEQDFALAQASLRKAILELHVGNRRKRRNT